ncbi:hypothetical protein GCM10010499_34770 [Streptomyces thermoviolaceus subsp. apingens]|nr:hypothetical protein GCM10010499_34770 [Streptomyces thermoviolaceus subsp. apingens]
MRGAQSRGLGAHDVSASVPRGVSAVAGLLIAAGEGWVSWRADVLTAVQAAGLVFAECGGRVTGGRGVVARPVGDALPKAAVV